MAGLTKIPAIIRNLDDKESSKVALIENLQRRDLTPIEEARTYQKILEIDSLTQEELEQINNGTAKIGPYSFNTFGDFAIYAGPVELISFDPNPKK